MEKIVIQTDKGDLLQVENFIQALCDGYHLGNYAATISVPVLKAVELALAADKTQQDVVVESDYCATGVCFTIKSQTPCFSQDDASPLSSPAQLDESFLFFQMLADSFEVLEQGKMITFIFAVRGINPIEAENRMSVIQQFFSANVHEMV